MILLGDYTDAYEQNYNTKLYLAEMDFLISWKIKLQAKGIQVITLMGNHDAPYLTLYPKYYSLRDSEGFILVHNKLLTLGLQVAFQLGDYLVSHAGYTKDFEPKKWHFEPITRDKSNEDEKYYLLNEEYNEKSKS